MQMVSADEVIETLGMAYFKELSTFGALSEDVIADMLQHGTIRQFDKGEFLARYGVVATDFQVVLQGRIAFYKHSDTCDVLTRHFDAGEQMGFDLMIGGISHNGIDVAAEPSIILDIDSDQFYQLLVDFPAEFGLLMVNLTRELSREISLLEGVIGKTTGWQPGKNGYANA